MELAMSLKKETVYTILGAVITVFALICAGFVIKNIVSENKADASEPVTTTYARPTKAAPVITGAGGTETKMRENMEVIMVCGIDNRNVIPEDNDYVHYSQADVIYVYAIDHKNKTYQCIQINRDTMTPVKQVVGIGEDTVANMQICLAHSYGKTEQARCLNTVDAVEGLLFDVPIDHYISLNLSAISVLNEQVGGVTVTIPAGMEKADPAFVEGATIRLQGNQAETFVRARMQLDDDSNIFRMHRQEIFMKAWKEQAKAKMNEESGFPVKMVLALSDYMTSDMTANALSTLANQLKEYKDLGTLTTTGETLEEGDGRLFREFHVDKEDLKKKVIELFYEEVPAT